MGLDPVQWVFLGLQLLESITLINLFTWFISGGWEYVLRTFGFRLDTYLVSLIQTVYKYFLKIINGTLFNEDVIEELMKNIYVFVGIIMFFRLMMLIIKYLVNPDLVSDAKIGVNSLIKRVVIGLMGILFIPSLFDIALNLQKSIMQDNLIQQIIIPNKMLTTISNRQPEAGKYMGTYVLAGFISPGANANQKTKNEYKQALDNGDLSGLSTLRKDGFLVGEFQYEYFYLISTFCLGYVLLQLIKFALDILVRYLRMLVYQMLSPIAMIEYMINGSDDGVFKSWQKGVLGTYFMYFVRVLSLWFVVFVTLLMSTDKNNVYVKGSLLADDDYLLRGFIVIAVIGFMMDLPKIIGQLFGLDLEQESNASGMLKQVGGMLKGAAMGVLAFGGAAVGSAIGTGKALGGTLASAKLFKDKDGNALSLKDKMGNRLKNAANNNGFLKNLSNNQNLSGITSAYSALQTSAKEHNLKDHMDSAKKGLWAAAMSSNSVTKAAYGGYIGQKEEQKKVDSQAQQAAKEEHRHREMVNAIEGSRLQQIDNQTLSAAMTIAARIQDSGLDLTPREMAVRMKPEEVGTINANIQGKLANFASTQLTTSDVAGGNLTASGTAKVRQEVEQIVVSSFASQGMSNPPQQVVDQHVNAIMSSVTPNVDSSGTVTLQADTSAVSASVVGLSDQAITQTINQVQGTNVNTKMEDLTQTINQNINRIATNTEEMNVYAEISTEHIENIRQDVSQQVDIQRDIRTNTEETNVYAEISTEHIENIRQDVSQQVDDQRDIRNNTDDINSNTRNRNGNNQNP